MSIFSAIANIFKGNNKQVTIKQDKKDPRLTRVEIPEGMSIHEFTAQLVQQNETDKLMRVFSLPMKDFFDELVKQGKKGDIELLNRYLDTAIHLSYKVYKENGLLNDNNDEINLNEFAQFIFLPSSDEDYIKEKGFFSIERVIPSQPDFINNPQLTNTMIMYKFYQDNKHTGIFDREF